MDYGVWSAPAVLSFLASCLEHGLAERHELVGLADWLIAKMTELQGLLGTPV